MKLPVILDVDCTILITMAFSFGAYLVCGLSIILSLILFASRKVKSLHHDSVRCRRARHSNQSKTVTAKTV